MSTFNRLFDLAGKALGDKTRTSAGSGGAASTDWRSMVQKAADSLTGEKRPVSTTPPPASGSPAATTGSNAAMTDADRAAIARYDYLMQTADPQQIERIHRDAFARLTPAQRAEVQARMNAELPSYEQPRSADPADLARAAARTEAMQPGRMRGLLGRAGGKAGLVGAGAAAGGVLGLVAGGAIASAVALPLLAQPRRSAWTSSRWRRASIPRRSWATGSARSANRSRASVSRSPDSARGCPTSASRVWATSSDADPPLISGDYDRRMAFGGLHPDAPVSSAISR